MDTYYDPKDLAKFSEITQDASDLGRKFFDYYSAVFAEGHIMAVPDRKPWFDVELP